MLLGLFRAEPTPEPAWFSALSLDSSGNGVRSLVHFRASGRASRHDSCGLDVVAESSGASGGQVDAAGIAAAYHRWGIDCVQRLPGRFRFLLYDAKARRVFATSSTAPPWPLAYWSDSRTTIVSSRLLPMLRCPDVARALDESYLVHHVMGLSAMNSGSTVLRSIRRLCPGEALIVDPDGVRVSRVDRLTARDMTSDRERLGDVFVEELGKAVASSAQRARTVVSFSGGLDSAALVGAGLRHTEGDLAALAFVAAEVDRGAEIESIDAMERKWPRLHVTRVDASQAPELPDLGRTELRDDPSLTPLALLPARMLLWSRAREAGFQTVIEGEGGDELFSMLPTPLDAFRHGRILDAARHVLGSSGRRALVEHGLWLPLLPESLQAAWLTRRQPLEAHLPAFAAWDAREHPAVREATREYLATLVHRPFATRLDEWLAAPTVVGAALTRRRLAAGFGLELEWPMLERSVLELILGLHAKHALHGGSRKPFLQDALVGVVPDEVRLLPKNIGLYNAFIPRVLTSPRSRAALRDARVRARLAELVRFERIEAMLDGLAAGRSLSTTALWQLECIISFAEWYARASREYGVD